MMARLRRPWIVRRAAPLLFLAALCPAAAAATLCESSMAWLGEREACTGPAGQGLQPLKLGDRWGFVDREGRLAIPPAFEAVDRFAEGLAPARSGGLWGFIDRKGRWAIEPRFSHALPFAEGRAFVRLQGGGAAAVERSGRIGHGIEAGFEPHLPYAGGVAVLRRFGALRLLSADRAIDIPPEAVPLAPPASGRIAALRLIPGERASRMGFLDEHGRWAIAAEYDEVNTFLGDFAAVRQRDRWWLIDRSGTRLKPLPAQKVTAQRGFWVLEPPGSGPESDSRVYLRPDGSPLLDAGREAAWSGHRFLPLSAPQPGGPLALLVPKREGDPAGIVRADGRAMFDAAWLEFGPDALEQREWPVVVRGRGGWGAVDAEGRWVVPPRMKSLERFRDGRAAFVQVRAAGIASRDGGLRFAPPDTSWSAVLPNGLAVFRQDGRSGVMDAASLAVRAAPRYDAVEPAGERLLKVMLDGRSGLIDVMGREILAPDCADLQEIVHGAWLCRRMGEGAGALTLVDEEGGVTHADRLDSRSPPVLAVGGRRGLVLAGGRIRWIGAEGVALKLWLDPGPDRAQWGLHLSRHRFRWIDRAGRSVRELDAMDVQRGAAGDLVQLERELRLAGGGSLHRGDYVLESAAPVLVLTGDGKTRVFDRAGAPGLELDGEWDAVSSRWLANREIIGAVRLYDRIARRERELGSAVRLEPGGPDRIRYFDGAAWGYLDQTLAPVIAARFTAAGPFADGAAWVERDAELQLIDGRGRVLGRAALRCATPVWLDAGGAVRWPPGAGCGRSGAADVR